MFEFWGGFVVAVCFYLLIREAVASAIKKAIPTPKSESPTEDADEMLLRILKGAPAESSFSRPTDRK
jgi:hypothetical protein